MGGEGGEDEGIGQPGPYAIQSGLEQLRPVESD